MPTVSPRQQATSAKTRKATPAKKAAPAKRTTPVKKAAPAKKAVPVRKATPAKRTTTAKKAAPAKKATPARKATPVKKVTPPATAKKTTTVKKEVKPAVETAQLSVNAGETLVVKRGRGRPRKNQNIEITEIVETKKPRGRRSKNDMMQEKYSVLFGDDEKLTQLWIDYKLNQSAKAREDLIVHYQSLVRYSVSRLNLSLPSALDRNDLNGYGVIGLMDAMEKFDLDRGLKFETYAVTRIKGAIIDELRTLDWVPRSVRTKIRAVEKAYTELEHELGRTPTDDEVAERAEMEVSEVRSVMSVYANTYVGTLDEQTGENGENSDTSRASKLVDKSDLLPGEEFEESETRYEMADHIRGLEERERAVVALYYFEGLTLAEVGKVLGVTESRVCQIHTKALNSLRSNAKLFRPED